MIHYKNFIFPKDLLNYFAKGHDQYPLDKLILFVNMNPQYLG